MAPSLPAPGDGYAGRRAVEQKPGSPATISEGAERRASRGFFAVDATLHCLKKNPRITHKELWPAIAVGPG